MTGIPNASIFGEVSDEVMGRLRALITEAGHAALATSDPADGHPLCTRVGLAWRKDGWALVFVSALAAHTPALLAEPRCSLLIGAVGKGDPLAHARIMLKCAAARIDRSDAEFGSGMQTYLQRQPKARLYADLPDFILFALRPLRATFNEGFGKAYQVNAQDWVSAFGDTKM